jgi:LacI family transcriptional regulator
MKARRERIDPPTIMQVAGAAGVSKATVSRAFTRPEMLSAETVRRIHAIAAEIGYVPNHTARALSTGRHGNLALIVPDVANPFFPPLIRAAQMEADRSDFCIFLGNSDEDPRQEDRLVDRFLGQVEGVILVSSRLPDADIRAHATRLPVVLVNRDVPGVPRVLIDSALGVAEAVEHLASLGHRKIVYVSGPSNSWSNQQRRKAVRHAAGKLDVEIVTVPCAAPTYEASRLTVGPILETGSTAAIAFDDMVAQGILSGLAERGIAVPKRFSVVGCDDVLGAATYPALTTVSNRSREAGKAALSLMLDILQTHAMSDARYILDTHLVVRGTTASAAGNAPVVSKARRIKA